VRRRCFTRRNRRRRPSNLSPNLRDAPRRDSSSRHIPAFAWRARPRGIFAPTARVSRRSLPSNPRCSQSHCAVCQTQRIGSMENHLILQQSGILPRAAIVAPTYQLRRAVRPDCTRTTPIPVNSDPRSSTAKPRSAPIFNTCGFRGYWLIWDNELDPADGEIVCEWGRRTPRGFAGAERRRSGGQPTAWPWSSGAPFAK
jgi:hypothetical protein